MTEVQATESNGSGPVTARDLLAAEIQQLAARRDEMQQEWDEINAQLRQHEKALKVLDGIPLGNPQGKPAKTPTAKDPSGTKVGPERLAKIEAMVRELAGPDGSKEVRQLDIREKLGVSSSVSAGAFQMLRDRNVIRLARQEGNSRFYRLTREAVREGESA